MEQNKNCPNVGHMAVVERPPVEVLSGGELAISRGMPINEISIHPVRAVAERIGQLSLVSTVRALPSKSLDLARTVKTNGLEIARAAKIDIKKRVKINAKQLLAC